MTSAGARLDRDSLARAGAGLRRAAVDANREPRRDDARAARPSCWPAPSGSRRCSGRCASRSPRRRSFRPTPRWPSACTSSRSSTRARAASSASSTSTAGSARSGSRSPHAWARCGGSSSIEEAIADAIANARANEVDNARFFAGDVRLALRELVARAGRPDVVIVDPPRAGLSQKVVRRIIEAAPQRIVYVSCNPTTLAPNAAQLVRGRLPARARAPGRHVPADTAHRVRRRADALGRSLEKRPSGRRAGWELVIVELAAALDREACLRELVEDLVRVGREARAGCCDRCRTPSVARRSRSSPDPPSASASYASAIVSPTS